MDEFIIGKEATGIFPGTLLEDMIDTVKRTKKLYCDVDIPRFYNSTTPHPLTYVPLWATTLPLKKGDKVFVRFHQDDLTLPVLWKLNDDIDTGIYEKYDPPSVDGTYVEKIEAADTFYAEKFGDDSFVIKTANYTVFRQNNAYILLDKDDNVFTYGKNVNISSKENTNVDIMKALNMAVQKNVDVHSNQGVIYLENEQYSLADTFADLIDFLRNDLCGALSALHTEGSPTNHVAANWAAEKIAMAGTGLLAKLTALEQKINTVFPKKE